MPDRLRLGAGRPTGRRYQAVWWPTDSTLSAHAGRGITDIAGSDARARQPSYIDYNYILTSISIVSVQGAGCRGRDPRAGHGLDGEFDGRIANSSIRYKRRSGIRMMSSG